LLRRRLEMAEIEKRGGYSGSTPKVVPKPKSKGASTNAKSNSSPSNDAASGRSQS
jgi:hypothetical protein